jgi:hypothetical protein
MRLNSEDWIMMLAVVLYGAALVCIIIDVTSKGTPCTDFLVSFFP